MARRVYFAFHYDDVFRVNVVRNSWRMHPSRDSSGYFDASLWEKAKRESELSLKRLINKGLENTSVTVFLLGAETAGRRWVNYELVKSVERGNGLLAVRIHQIKKPTWVGGTQMGLPGSAGPNILDQYRLQNSYSLQSSLLSSSFSTQDWVAGNGYVNLGRWVEDAASRAANAYRGRSLVTSAGRVPFV